MDDDDDEDVVVVPLRQLSKTLAKDYNPGRSCELSGSSSLLGICKKIARK